MGDLSELSLLLLASSELSLELTHTLRVVLEIVY